MSQPPKWLAALSAIVAALRQPKKLPLPEGAKREIGKHVDLEAYRESGGGMAPDDAPHIPDDGRI